MTNEKPAIELKHYDVVHFPFRLGVEALLGCKFGTRELEELHKQPGAPSEVVQTGKDNHTPWHQKFYDGLAGSAFERWYLSFIRLWIKPMFGGSIVFQRRPTFRIHWVGNLSVGAFHRDSQYNHPANEVNFWVPVTNAWGTNSIWIESETDKADFAPMRVEYGNALIFPGGLLCHGNKINDTDETRVSFDFRVIPKSEYIEDPSLMGLAFGKRRVVGDYYAEA